MPVHKPHIPRLAGFDAENERRVDDMLARSAVQSKHDQQNRNVTQAAQRRKHKRTKNSAAEAEADFVSESILSNIMASSPPDATAGSYVPGDNTEQGHGGESGVEIASPGREPSTAATRESGATTTEMRALRILWLM